MQCTRSYANLTDGSLTRDGQDYMNDEANQSVLLPAKADMQIFFLKSLIWDRFSDFARASAESSEQRHSGARVTAVFATIITMVESFLVQG